MSIGSVLGSVAKFLVSGLGVGNRGQNQGYGGVGANGGTSGQSAVSAYLAAQKSGGANINPGVPGSVDPTFAALGAKLIANGQAYRASQGTDAPSLTLVSDPLQAAAPAPSTIAPGVVLTENEKISTASKALDTDAALVAGQAATYTATPNATNMLAFQVSALSSVKDAAAAVGPTTPKGVQLTGIYNQMSASVGQMGTSPTDPKNAQVVTDMQAQLSSAQSLLRSTDAPTVLSGADAATEAKHLSGTVAALQPAVKRLDAAAHNPTGGDLTAAATNASSVFKSVAAQLGPNDPLAGVLTNRAGSLDRAVANGDPVALSLAASTADADIGAEIRGLASLLPTTGAKPAHPAVRGSQVSIDQKQVQI